MTEKERNSSSSSFRKQRSSPRKIKSLEMQPPATNIATTAISLSSSFTKFLSGATPDTVKTSPVQQKMRNDTSSGDSDDDDDDYDTIGLDNSELWSSIRQWRDNNILNDQHAEEICHDDFHFSSPIRKPSSTPSSRDHPALTSSKRLNGLKPVPGLSGLSASATFPSTRNSRSHRQTKNGGITTTATAANSKNKSSSPNMLARKAIAEFIERHQLRRGKVLADIDDPNRNEEYFLSARENSSTSRRQRTFKNARDS
jgi:hypothetical protein